MYCSIGCSHLAAGLAGRGVRLAQGAPCCTGAQGIGCERAIRRARASRLRLRLGSHTGRWGGRTATRLKAHGHTLKVPCPCLMSYDSIIPSPMFSYQKFVFARPQGSAVPCSYQSSDSVQLSVCPPVVQLRLSVSPSPGPTPPPRSPQDALTEAQYLEQQARALLASARNDQVAAQRALLLQVRRMQALEAMRLTDLQVGLESRLSWCGFPGPVKAAS